MSLGHGPIAFDAIATTPSVEGPVTPPAPPPVGFEQPYGGARYSDDQAERRAARIRRQNAALLTLCFQMAVGATTP